MADEKLHLKDTSLPSIKDRNKVIEDMVEDTIGIPEMRDILAGSLNIYESADDHEFQVCFDIFKFRKKLVEKLCS